MKWTHSKVFDSEFLSEWQATEDACELAMDFDYYTSYHFCNATYVKKVTPAMRERRVHFHTSVEVASGATDIFDADAFSMPMDALAGWTEKPWRLRSVPKTSASSIAKDAVGPPVEDPRSSVCISRTIPDRHPEMPTQIEMKEAIYEFRITDNYYNVLPRWERPGELPDEDAMHEGDVPAFLHEAPGSIQNLFDQFLDDGYINGGPGLDESIFLRSWYLHHVNVPAWHRPRTIELHGHWRHWMRDILNGWVDQIYDDQDVELFLCHPHPPRSGDVTYDLLVVQGTWAPRRAGLTTVLRLNDLAARAHYAVAVSYTPFVSGYQLAVSVNMEQHCQTQICTIRHGRTVIPFSMDPVHEMTDGDTFTIAPRSSEAAAGVQQTQCNPAEVEQQDPPEQPPHDESRRHDQGDDPPTPMDDEDSGFSSDEDPQGVHVYRLGHFPVFGYADWRTYHTILRDAVQMVRLRLNQVPAFHFVRARMDGLQAVEEAIIVQHIHDIPVGSLEKLVIIDVKMHTRNRGGRVPHPPLVKRQVYRVLHQLTRSHILMIAEVDAYCAWMQDQCVVTLDNEHWDQRDLRLRDVHHGTYVKIEVPPPPEPHWNTAAAIRVAQDISTMVDPREAGDLISQTLAAEFGEVPTVLGGGQVQQHKPCEIEEDIDVPMTLPPGTRKPSSRPRLDGDWTWLNSLVEIFAAEAEAEVIDGTPLLYIQTWFVHHLNHPRCDHPRPIRLDNSIIIWLEELRFAWRDLLDRTRPLTVKIVRPRPPQPRHHGYACHVLIEQARPDNRAAGIITHLFEGPDRDAIQQYAAALPHIVRSPDVIDELRLNLWCDFRRCQINIGGQPISLVVAQELRSGFSMCIRIAAAEQQLPHPPVVRGEPFADISFLQTHISLPKQVVASHEIPGHHDGPMPFAFNPHAPPFDPVQPSLNAQNEFVQSLHSEWDNVAFSWEGEERSCEVDVWFADHRAPMPHGIAPRRVRLWSNHGQWEQVLRTAWYDQIDPNAILEFHLVAPAPPLLEAGIAAHIILVQNPNEAWVTSLVTLFDFTDPTQQVRYFRRAVTTGEHIYLEHLVIGMDFAGTCILRPSQFQCNGWYGALLFVPGRPLPGRSGYGIVVQVRRTPRYQPAICDAQQPANPRALRLDHLLHGTPALQQAVQLQAAIAAFLHIANPPQHSTDGAPWIPDHAQPQPNRTPEQLQINMQVVYAELNAFDQHFLVPHYHLGQWNGFMHWLDDWWDCQSPVTSIWIYHDGACRPEGTGAAAAAFLYQSGRGWVFGGALSIALGENGTSYGAELRGGLLAIQLCIDLLKITALYQDQPPEVKLLHDNTAVGNQIPGRWNATAEVRIVALVRHLTVYLEHRFGCTVQTQYVAAHRGDLGNELVDGLAGEAATGHPLSDLAPWLASVLNEDFGKAAAWFWLLYCPQFASWWQGENLCLPLTATTQPTKKVLPDDAIICDSQRSGTIDLTIGTCNVLTLKASKCTKHHDDTTMGVDGPTRQSIVFQQFLDAQVCIFALQETRLRRCGKNILGYQIYKGDATPHGHHGVLLAISTTIPYGSFTDAQGQQHLLYFKPQDLSLIEAGPRHVLLRVRSPWLKCILVAGHAPHSGHELAEIESWWETLAQALPSTLQHWPIILLADANAKVGADTCESIGSHGAEEGTEKAMPFTSFVRGQDLWLPSTFSCHEGVTGTWHHSSGKWLRNDYVGLPKQWPLSKCTSWVSDEIDVSLHHEDHKAALVHLVMPATCDSPRHSVAPVKSFVTTADLAILRTSPIIEPGLDVHTHAAQLQDQVLHCLPRRTRLRGPRQQKRTLTSTTWRLVLQKRQWRNTLKELNQLQRTTFLQAYFVAWREGAKPTASATIVAIGGQFQQLLCDQDRSIATALAEFRALGRLVTTHSRADDVRFYQELLAEGAQFLDPSQSKDLWKTIKRSLPKYRQRKIGVDPLRVMALEDEWNPHFATLEAGCVIHPQVLLEEACECQPAARLERPPSMDELPTLFDFERVLRANKPGRATGNDPLTSALYHNHAPELAEHAFSLLLKVWIWGVEPIQYKGGPMALIPKRVQPTMVQHYRGILLLPTLAKGIHALLRQRIMKLLQHQRLPGQLGGFAQQEVLYGSHTLRILGRAAQAHHFSMGVLFVDLSTAFHSLVREMVVGIHDPQKLHFVMDALHWSTDAQQRLQLGREVPGILERLGAPPFLVRLLRNVHDSTWTTINGQEYIRTHRGTRPGSPIADAIFHFIMYDFSLSLQRYLELAGHTQFLEDELQMEANMVIWSDDLAVPVVTHTATELVPALMQLLDFVKREFAARGFMLNLAKGKTGIVATFCGTGAAALRRQYQLIPQPGVQHTFEDGMEHFVHMSPSYRHLGTLYTSDQQLDAEISFRIGVAVAAFEQIKKNLLANRHFPFKLRLQLFHSLVLTKLYFAAGTWHSPTGRQCDRIRNAVARMLKKMQGRTCETLSAPLLLARAGVLEPRVRIASERLLYAQRLFHHGPAYLQLMIHAETAHGDAPWLVGLRHDLKWLHGVETTADPLLIVEQDMTDLIDAWQRDHGQWKRRIRRAGMRHLFQEAMISEAHQWHAEIFDVLRSRSFTFNPDPALLHVQECFFPCPDCPRWFTTPQGVHTHRRKAHGVYCPEHHLLDSATCPACLTYLWSTQRVQQHLSYMPRDGTPNACFAYLQQIGYKVSYTAEHLPTALAGQSRLDALAAAGPFGHGPTARERRLWRLQTTTDELRLAFHTYESPAQPERMGERLGDLLTQVTLCWFKDFVAASHHFEGIERPQDRWIDVLCKLPDVFQSWTARVFILWGRHVLPDLIAGLWDGEAEAYLDEEYASLVVDFDEYQMENKIRQLERQIQDERQQPIPPAPHRPVRPMQQNARPRSVPQHEVVRMFDRQEHWHNDLCRVRWEDMPMDPHVPRILGLSPRPTFLIVHLFAGRRRETDIHAWLNQWADQRNIALTILSLDTAISPVLGNLDAQSESWKRLQELYLQGHVAATISGHPCETFSSARWTPPPADRPHARWPRPLRTAMQLFGLDHRTWRELSQTRLGTAFFLQTMWVLACHIAFGGLFVEEHPGVPLQPDHPSIWRSAIMKIMKLHPDVKFHEIGQWRFGATSVKPTGLLALRLPYFLRDLYKHADDAAVRPKTHAIGVDERGQFRTSSHKEYPPRLSAGIANAIGAQLMRDLHARRTRDTANLPLPLTQWITDVARDCSGIRQAATWLPDFQG